MASRTIKCLAVKDLIVAQLEAAAPASLTTALIYKEIRYARLQINEEAVEKFLQELVENGLAVRVDECGFAARYKLVDEFSKNIREN